MGTWADLVAAPTVFEPEASAPMFGTETTGISLVVRWTWILLASTTTGATMTRLPGAGIDFAARR